MDQPNSEGGETKNGTVRAYLGGISIALSVVAVPWVFISISMMMYLGLSGYSPNDSLTWWLESYGWVILAAIGLVMSIVGTYQEGDSKLPIPGIVLNALLLIVGLFLIAGS